MNTSTHRAGFVHIIGKPNVGKSTLFNRLVEYPLSIVSPKPQTTRQNILGIEQSDDHQAIYIDTPGYLQPKYQLQRIMMRNVHRALAGSDILLWIVDICDEAPDPSLFAMGKKGSNKLILLLNKIDLIKTSQLSTRVAIWQERKITEEVWSLSAEDPVQVAELAQKIIAHLPIHPPFYDKKTFTDRSERFFAAEIIRKALFFQYKEEIPYSTEVVVEKFQDSTDLLVIDVTIHVERLNQKGIVIGKKGQALKQVGIRARQELEEFFQKKVFLTQYVKVLPEWRNRKTILAEWGYR